MTSHITLVERSAATGAVTALYYNYLGAGIQYAAAEGAHIAVSRAIAESLLEHIIEGIERFIPAFALHLADSARVDLAGDIATAIVNTTLGRFTNYNYIDDREMSGFFRGVIYNTVFAAVADIATSFKSLVK